MSFHPRFDKVEAAHHEVTGALLDVFAKHKLTLAERARILADELERVTRNLVRDERHPRNPWKKADEA